MALAHDEKTLSYVHQDRRYVDNRETVAYIIYAGANSFNINGYKQRFIYDVLLINFNFLAFLSMVGGIWDVVNDTIIGVLVDRTRTRWGKFRPYLIGFNIPMSFISAFYWIMPFIFMGTNDRYFPKLIAYFIFSVVTETAGTFTSISATGLMSTITPHPVDRTRLITQSNLWSGLFGSNIPRILMGVLLDLINNGIVDWKLRDLFAGMGLLTNFVAAAASLYFFLVSRERVMQSIEKPSIIQGIKAILNNKPILLITLSEFLNGFAISNSRTDYYIDVLGSATLQLVVGIPGGIFTYGGYFAIPWFRRTFSTRTLWIIEDLWSDACWLAVVGIGLINNNFTKRSVMIPTMMIEECFEMCVYALRTVIPAELYNEAMDYCEWKNGYRTEAMTGVARGLITKLQAIVNNSVKSLIMNKIGYVQGKKIGTQDMSTKRWLFIMGTGMPVVTGALGIIPKFLYPLTGERRDKMYEELIARRELTAKTLGSSENAEA